MPQLEATLTANALRVLEARYLRTDAAGHVVETPGEMFRRVATHVAAAAGSNRSSPLRTNAARLTARNLWK